MTMPAKAMTALEAYKLAATLHRGQVDKAGHPYIEHLTRVFLSVCSRGGDLDQQVASLLHDAIEDGKTDAEGLLRAGVSAASVDIISTLTKTDGQSYADYLSRTKSHEKAVLVKVCDVLDNADPERLAKLPDNVSLRLRNKYAAALSFLETPPEQSHTAPDRPRP